MKNDNTTLSTETLLSDFPVRKTLSPMISTVDFDHLEFGRYVSDHMLVCDFKKGKWLCPQIIPFSNLSLSPSTLALHYGQTVFEGMKAFRMNDGRINIFRIDKHQERFALSLNRMCMPAVPREIFTEGMLQLIAVDKTWVPSKEGDSLYIRPFMFASEARFGIKISEEYRFIIFSGPVASLYAEPIKVKVETEYIRAARGGTGSAKCGGNYGGALYPTLLAKQQGYDQVLWTDGVHHKFIEESGMMNVMFVINNELFTAPLSDSILDGVTRDSLLTIAKDLGYTVHETAISVSDLENAFKEGKITEAFGAGTAAVVAPIKTIQINGMDHHIAGYTNKSICHILKNNLEAIRTGADADIHGWNFILV